LDRWKTKVGFPDGVEITHGQATSQEWLDANVNFKDGRKFDFLPEIFCGCYPIVAFLTAQFSWVLVQLRLTFFSAVFVVCICAVIFFVSASFINEDILPPGSKPISMGQVFCIGISVICFTLGSMRENILARTLFLIEYQADQRGIDAGDAVIQQEEERENQDRKDDEAKMKTKLFVKKLKKLVDKSKDDGADSEFANVNSNAGDSEFGDVCDPTSKDTTKWRAGSPRGVEAQHH